MKNFRYNSGATMLTGVGLCLVGLYFWVANYYPDLNLLKYLNLAKNWPFFLVAVGFYLIVLQYNCWDDNDTK